MLRCVKLRAAILIIIVTLFGQAYSDWNVDFPTAYTLRSGEARIDYRTISGNSENEWLANFGLLPFLECSIQSGDNTRVNFQYSITQPYPEVAPGLAVGVLDAFDEGEAGRSLYIAATFQFNIVSNWAKRERANISLGIGTGELRKGAFVGLSLPIFPCTTVLAEFFGKKQTIGLDIELIRGLGFRAMVRDGLPSFAIQFRRLF